MRTYQYTLQRLGAGLRPSPRIYANQRLLYKAYNVRAYGDYLDVPEVLTNPISGQTVTPPFPQLHLGPYWSLLFTEDKIYSVNTSTWALTELTFYHYSTGVVTDIVEGGQWHIVDLHSALYAFNGSCIIYIEGLELVSEDRQRWYIVPDVTITTGAYSRGRVICGGFDVADVWTNWTSEFASWGADILPVRITSDGEYRVTSDGTKRGISGARYTWQSDIGSNYVMWGSIGGSDFPLWLFYPQGRGEDYDKTLDRIEWAIQRNEFGWMPMPWRGTVQAILPIGKGVMVYGTGGTTMLTAYQSQQYADAPPTFGVDMSWPARIACRSAVDGDERGHLMVADDGNLWLRTGEEFTRLGYEEYFAADADQAVVKMHRDSGDFYITIPDTSYLLSAGGLTEVMDKVTSIQENYATISYRKAQSLELITQEFDLGERARKTITGIALQYRGLATVRVAVQYRFRPEDEFLQTPFRALSPEGYAFLRCEGTDFRVVVNAYKRDAFYLDGIRVDYQIPDRRYTRGPTASEVVARTD